MRPLFCSLWTAHPNLRIIWRGVYKYYPHMEILGFADRLWYALGSMNSISHLCEGERDHGKASGWRRASRIFPSARL